MFITFEGIEGAGKGTVLQLVQNWLGEQKLEFCATREPGASELGKILRGILLDVRSHVVPRAELFLYLADRAQHVQEIIRPALVAGKIVLSDRYADSTMVYQGYGRELCLEKLRVLNDMAVDGLWPDTTYLLDLPPELGLARANKRNAELGLSIKEGRFEAESLAFHTRIRNGYLDFARAEPERFVVIDATKSPTDVFAQVLQNLQAKIKKHTAQA